MSSNVAPISIPFNQTHLTSELLHRHVICFLLICLSLGNSSHCCQGIFLKEESHQVNPFAKPLWDFLAHSIESYSWTRDYLTWPGLLLTPLPSPVHLCSPHLKVIQATPEILQAPSCLLIVAPTEILAPYLDAWSLTFQLLWTNWNVNHLPVLPSWCHCWPSFSGSDHKCMRVYKRGYKCIELHWNCLHDCHLHQTGNTLRVETY